MKRIILCLYIFRISVLFAQTHPIEIGAFNNSFDYYSVVAEHNWYILSEKSGIVCVDLLQDSLEIIHNESGIVAPVNLSYFEDDLFIALYGTNRFLNYNLQNKTFKQVNAGVDNLPLLTTNEFLQSSRFNIILSSNSIFVRDKELNVAHTIDLSDLVSNIFDAVFYGDGIIYSGSDLSGDHVICYISCNNYTNQQVLNDELRNPALVVNEDKLYYLASDSGGTALVMYDLLTNVKSILMNSESNTDFYGHIGVFCIYDSYLYYLDMNNSVIKKVKID